MHRRVLGEDRNALFPLKITRIHNALTTRLYGVMIREGSGLPQHCIHESRLTVIHVGNDRDVANIFANSHFASRSPLLSVRAGVVSPKGALYYLMPRTFRSRTSGSAKFATTRFRTAL